MTTLLHPLLPDPRPQPGIPLPISPGQGMWKKLLESKALVYFFFRSWEQRGQNLKRHMTEKGKRVSEGRKLLSPSSGQSSPYSGSHSPLPPRLGSQPNTGKVEPLNGTLEKEEDGRSRSGTGRGEAKERKEPPHPQFLRDIPLFCPLGEFLKVPRPTISNHLPPTLQPTFNQDPPPHSCIQLPRVPRTSHPEAKRVLTSGLSQPIISP